MSCNNVAIFFFDFCLKKNIKYHFSKSIVIPWVCSKIFGCFLLHYLYNCISNLSLFMFCPYLASHDPLAVTMTWHYARLSKFLDLFICFYSVVFYSSLFTQCSCTTCTCFCFCHPSTFAICNLFITLQPTLNILRNKTDDDDVFIF